MRRDVVMNSPAERYRSFIERGGVVDLRDRVKLRLTGADRVRFLNGQVTVNVAQLAEGTARPACIATAKGRLCADVFVCAEGESLFIDADAALRESLQPRLERYIVADDVAIEDVSAAYRLIHLLGPLADRDPLPSCAYSRRATRLGQPGIDLWIERAHFDEAWATLHATAAILDETLTEPLRIAAGIPRWGRELDEDTLPPEAGLDRTHIDYDKGCYVGQETISRLKSIGHVNRALAGFIADEALEPGWRLWSGNAEVGHLTSTAWSFALEKHIALGYLKRASPTGELLARAADESGGGRLVVTRDLPFPA